MVKQDKAWEFWTSALTPAALSPIRNFWCTAENVCSFSGDALWDLVIQPLDFLYLFLKMIWAVSLGANLLFLQLDECKRKPGGHCPLQCYSLESTLMLTCIFSEHAVWWLDSVVAARPSVFLLLTKNYQFWCLIRLDHVRRYRQPLFQYRSSCISTGKSNCPFGVSLEWTSSFTLPLNYTFQLKSGMCWWHSSALIMRKEGFLVPCQLSRNIKSPHGRGEKYCLF